MATRGGGMAFICGGNFIGGLCRVLQKRQKVKFIHSVRSDLLSLRHESCPSFNLKIIVLERVSLNSNRGLKEPKSADRRRCSKRLYCLQ